jgi:hypothetical protein
MNNSDSDEVLSTINYEGKHCLCQVDLQTANILLNARFIKIIFCATVREMSTSRAYNRPRN